MVLPTFLHNPERTYSRFYNSFLHSRLCERKEKPVALLPLILRYGASAQRHQKRHSLRTSLESDVTELR